jgi:hypothetical protein
MFIYSGEIAAEHPGKKVTIVQSGKSLLSNSYLPLTPIMLEKLMVMLKTLKIEVKLNAKVNTYSYYMYCRL